MIRAAELSVFLVPLVALLLLRLAVARGLPGPDPRQLRLIGVALVGLAALLFAGALLEHQKGRYVPAAYEGGRVVPGHTE